MRRRFAAGGAAIAGVVVGAVLTLGIQAWTLPTSPAARRPALPVTHPAAPETFLAWVPRGLPDGFAGWVERMPRVGRLTVVAEDNVWLVRTWSAAGELVDDTSAPFGSRSTSPRSTQAFAPFLPPADRGALAAVADGEDRGPARHRSGASAPEMLGCWPAVASGSRRCCPTSSWGGRAPRLRGARPPPGRPRSVRAAPAGRRPPAHLTIARRAIQPLVPRELGAFARVQVRAPGETPYFRAGDAVLPPVLLKALFGEFAARPVAGQRGALEVDPDWRRTHLVTTRIPVLGEITCHRGSSRSSAARCRSSAPPGSAI